jgi:hypothetical protein
VCFVAGCAGRLYPCTEEGTAHQEEVRDHGSQRGYKGPNKGRYKDFCEDVCKGFRKAFKDSGETRQDEGCSGVAFAATGADG